MSRLSSQWHIWFAWHPVITDNEDYRQLVWLEDVLRRRVLDLDLCDGSYKWEYKPIDNSILTD